MGKCVPFLVVFVLLLCATTAQAEWRVDIESKTVEAGEADVTVDITAYWDLPMIVLTVPVVVREIDPGSFWTGTLPHDFGNADPGVGVTWNWSNPGWADLYEAVEEYEGCATPGNGYDGVSPDNFCICVQGVLGETPAEPSGRVCVILEFDVTTQPGQFELDTACATPELRDLFIIDNQYVDHGPLGTGQCTFNKGIITISPSPNTPPDITCPTDPTYLTCDAVDLTFTAADDGQPSSPLTMSAENYPGFLSFADNGDNSGTLSGTPGAGNNGQWTVRCIADDGEFADTCFIIITVNEDTEPPMAICPGNQNVDADPGVCEAIVSFTIDATDNCPGVTVEATPPSGSLFPLGITEVEVVATDAVGDADTCYFDVQVSDNEDPVVTCPGNMTVDCDAGTDGAVVNYSATATDNCGIASIVYDPPSGSVFCYGTTPVTATATDNNGNIDVCTFEVTVNRCPWRDIVSSSITLLPNGNLEFAMTVADDIPDMTCVHSAFVWLLDIDQSDSEPIGPIFSLHDIETEYHIRVNCDPPNPWMSWIDDVDAPAVYPAGFPVEISGPTVTIEIDPSDIESPSAIDWFASTSAHETISVEDPETGHYTWSSCDCGIPGDVNNDGGAPNPLDVTFLVQRVYIEQDALYDYHGLSSCPDENGDVNGDGGPPTPLDVTFLVQKVYKQQDALCVDRCAGCGP